MSGVGRAGGAGTLVNAMATGKGAAFGLAFRVEARVEPSTTWGVFDRARELDKEASKLAVEAARQVVGNRPKQGLRIDVASNIPPERGLKSSSAVAVAVVRACLAHQGTKWPDARILRAAANAGLRSGTSITGAYDDAAACLLGDVVVTDNKNHKIVKKGRLPRGIHALVHVPDERLATGSLKGTDFRSVKALVAEAWEFARGGEYEKAMIINSAAYAGVLGHETRFSLEAIREGVWAAGLSGKGPAEIALGERSALERIHSLYPASRFVELRRGDEA